MGATSLLKVGALLPGTDAAEISPQAPKMRAEDRINNENTSSIDYTRDTEGRFDRI
jgi:hypothetical protein